MKVSVVVSMFVITALLMSGCRSNEYIITGSGGYSMPLSAVLQANEEYVSTLLAVGEGETLSISITAATKHASEQMKALGWDSHKLRLLKQSSEKTENGYSSSQMFLIYQMK